MKRVSPCGRRLGPALASILWATGAAATPPAPGPWRIEEDPAASSLERFAARELQRYVYVRTGALLPIGEDAGIPPGPSLFVATQAHALAHRAGSGAPIAPRDYRLRSGGPGAAQGVSIIGGDDVGTLYGVYRFAERLGVRFYLHGDVVPDARVPLEFPAFAEDGHALFSVRGLQPFHDFAEGPDWWSTDDYLCVVGQMAKLRMNFLGLHTYPEGGAGPEPTVWIGQPHDFDSLGRLSTAYPASYQTTGRGGRYWWSYAPMRTGDFLGGAADLYDRDDFGSDVMRGSCFGDQTPAMSAEVFNRTAAMLGTAFAEARRLGVLTCVGTETPLTLPAPVAEELRRQGRDPHDPAVVKQTYAAMFERIRRASPADYYWLWTPESWTWEGNGPGHFKEVADDIQAAQAALRDLHSPMTLATCGWVLGPQDDRAALDRLLPPSSPMSAINTAVGYDAIERQYANLSERPRWAIPWLENDGDLTSPELWTGRMRFDAADALRLGCTGLIGIHWRTRILAPSIAALAAAAWDQSWVPPGFDSSRIPPQTASGADGGSAVAATAPVAGTRQEGLYRTNRVGMGSYNLLVPSGTYRVRLGFSEIQGALPGRRVFSVRLQGAVALDHLDLAAKYGPSQAVVSEFGDVGVSNGHLLIEFAAYAGQAAIAVIEIDGVTKVGQAHYVKRINCGGPAWEGYEADQLPGQPRPPEDRTMPVDAFYRDFAAANFGAQSADGIGGVFSEIDGVKLPVPSLWIDGPGDIFRNPEPWAAAAAHYAFVERLESMRAGVRGSANLERFDYWLNQFRAMRLIAEIGCAAGALDREMAAIAALADPAIARERARTGALPLRLQLAALWTLLLRTEVAGASSLGELGTLANLEQRSRVHQAVLSRHDAALARLLGYDLPLAASPSRQYAGPARIIVPTVRTCAAEGESIRLRVLVVGEEDPGSVVLCWRWIGGTDYLRQPLHHVARRVYEASLPRLDSPNPAAEYHVEAVVGEASLRWPSSDHGLDQTVIMFQVR
ncbi:MAG TPA: malectin domain-containing carbohydrate-binding protein [Opitutaceae bacterium]|nr:malectin domain-containing carbohydrate-binding protein [Opitutaceae bacterium]